MPLPFRQAPYIQNVDWQSMNDSQRRRSRFQYDQSFSDAHLDIHAQYHSKSCVSSCIDCDVLTRSIADVNADPLAFDVTQLGRSNETLHGELSAPCHGAHGSYGSSHVVQPGPTQIPNYDLDNVIEMPLIHQGVWQVPFPPSDQQYHSANHSYPDEAYSWAGDAGDRASVISDASSPLTSPEMTARAGPYRTLGTSRTQHQHTPAAPSKRPEIKCEPCDRSFTRKSAWKRHQREQHDPVSYFACLDCRNNWRELCEFEEDGVLSSHWKCCFCDKLDPTSQHIMDVHPACVHSANLLWFTRSGAFAKHREEHDDRHHSTWDQCHVEERQPPAFRVCDGCGEVFEELSAYKKHVAESEKKRQSHNPRGTSITERSKFLTTSIKGLLGYPPIKQAFKDSSPAWFSAYDVTSDSMTWDFLDAVAQRSLQDLLHLDVRAPASEQGTVFETVVCCGHTEGLAQGQQALSLRLPRSSL